MQRNTHASLRRHKRESGGLPCLARARYAVGERGTFLGHSPSPRSPPTPTSTITASPSLAARLVHPLRSPWLSREWPTRHSHSQRASVDRHRGRRRRSGERRYHRRCRQLVFPLSQGLPSQGLPAVVREATLESRHNHRSRLCHPLSILRCEWL